MCAKSVMTVARIFANYRSNHPRMTADQLSLLNYFEKCVFAMRKKVPLQPWQSFGVVYFEHPENGSFPNFSVRCDFHGMILEIRGRDVLVVDLDHHKNIPPEETARMMFLRLGA